MTYPIESVSNISLVSSLSTESDSSSVQNLEHVLQDLSDYDLSDSEESYSTENTSESEILVISDESSINEPFLSEPSMDVIEEVDEIHNMDYQHLYSEKENKKYYIGICSEMTVNESLHLPRESIYLMVNSISNTTYFQWPHESSLRYLYYYGMTPMHNPKVDIMQLHILEDSTYSVIIKTFWLKIIQRKWKKIYQVRRRVLENRLQLTSLYHREVHGDWPVHMRTMPGLQGLMAC
jgi:hypothetical protein